MKTEITGTKGHVCNETRRAPLPLCTGTGFGVLHLQVSVGQTRVSCVIMAGTENGFALKLMLCDIPGTKKQVALYCPIKKAFFFSLSTFCVF